MCLFLMLLLCTSLVNLAMIYGYRDGLYTTEDDDVAILNNETFETNVVQRGPGTAWFVEFYNTWCGHCMQFAPIWKRVALDFANWRDIAVIAAIDCSQEKNQPTCRASNMTRYPAVKMYPPVDSTAVGASEMRTETLDTLKQQILEQVAKYTSDRWPNLTPLKQLDDIWADKKAHHEYELVIFEEDASLLGTQVILDLRGVGNVMVRRMVKRGVGSLDIKMWPSLYRVYGDYTYVMVAMGSSSPAEDRLAFVRVATSLARSGLDPTQSPGANPGQDEGGKSGRSFTVRRYNASSPSMQDLESALHYCLRHEVPMNSVIHTMKFHSLHNFVKVLVKYFPGRKPVRGFLSRVSEMLTNLKAQNVSGIDWTEMINHLKDKDHFLPEIVKWEACQGSTPLRRGYPCGMWMLFHTLTVQAYIQNADTSASSAVEVLMAVRDYMKDFFGCQECSRNFVWLARSIKFKVDNPRTAVLWLWESHNNVNKRLSRDPSEDPHFPKIEFPTKEMCPRCHVSSSSTKRIKSPWNREEVMKFLVKFYSLPYVNSSNNPLQLFQVIKTTENPQLVIKSRQITPHSVEKLKGHSTVQPGMLARGHQVHAKDVGAGRVTDLFDLSQKVSTAARGGQRVSNSEGLTQFDVSLCVMLYVTSTMILILLGYCFITRGCRGVKKYR